MSADKRHNEALPAIVGQYVLAKSQNGKHNGIGVITSVGTSININVVEQWDDGEYIRGDVVMTQTKWHELHYYNRLQIALGKKVVKKYALWLLKSNLQ